MLFLRALLLCWILSFGAQSVSGEQIPVIDLERDYLSDDVSDHLIYSRNYDGEISLSAVNQQLGRFNRLREGTMFFGRERGKILIIIGVRNPSSVAQTWFLHSNRHTANRLQIYLLGENGQTELFDDNSYFNSASSIRRFAAFGTTFTLSPNEVRYIAIDTDFENTGNIRFDILSPRSFFDQYHGRTFISGAIAVGLITIILLNLVLFGATNKPSFIWLSLAEFCLLYNYLHSSGLLFAFGLYQFPLAQYTSMQIAFWGMGIGFLQFWRGLLSTSDEHPLLDRVLKAGIAFCLALVFAWIVCFFANSSVRYIVSLINWVGLLPIGLSMPVFGWIAIKKLGPAYWPLFLGVSIYALLSIALFLEIIVFGTYRLHAPTLYGLAGFIEAFLITTSLSWGIYVTTQERATFLEDKLRLSEENSIAKATIEDQNAMLHASGHDTRQVLLAINSASNFLERSTPAADRNLLRTLRESASFLDDILSTTLSAQRSYSMERSSLALSGFAVSDLFRSLERIYAPAFRQKQLGLTFTQDLQIFTISDRALLMRALSNFIANSLAATKEGAVNCSSRIESGDLHISVHDTGVGMEPDLIKYLTDPAPAVVSASDAAERKSSGFRIAHDIINKLHGRLAVSSALGEGTSLEISLPCGFACLTKASAQSLAERLQYTLQDLDAGKRVEPRPEVQIAITFDDSSQMRHRAAEEYSLLLYKPLFSEVATHPAVIEIIASQASEPAE